MNAFDTPTTRPLENVHEEFELNVFRLKQAEDSVH
jgi:hypothetical protein